MAYVCLLAWSIGIRKNWLLQYVRPEFVARIYTAHCHSNPFSGSQTFLITFLSCTNLDRLVNYSFKPLNRRFWCLSTHGPLYLVYIWRTRSLFELSAGLTKCTESPSLHLHLHWYDLSSRLSAILHILTLSCTCLDLPTPVYAYLVRCTYNLTYKKQQNFATPSGHTHNLIFLVVMLSYLARKWTF